MVVFAAMSISFTAVTDMNARKSDNYRNAQAARLAAESGLAFMMERLQYIRLPADTTSETFTGNVYAALDQMFNGTANLAGQIVTIDGATVLVPEIEAVDKTFSSSFSWVDANRCRITIRGSTGQIHRRLAVDLVLEPRRAKVLDYGLASRGQISISGSAKILSVGNPSDASILSASASDEAIVLDGSVTIDGDLYTAGADTYVSITGSPSVAGSTDPVVIDEHLHEGVDPPDFPAVDISDIVPLATNLMDADTGTGEPVYNNIRIAAGTNPVFSSAVVLNGVIYVEAPNIVKFSGQTTLNALIITQDSDQPIANCQLEFSGGVQANGVEALPDTSEFIPVKQYTGTFILAPGFAASFSGNFGTIAGMIAADQLTFTGTAEGIVQGTVLGLADVPTTLSGNVEIRVDRQGLGDDWNPAGLLKSFAFVLQPNSYSELTGD